MLGAEITFISAMKQSISGMKMKYFYFQREIILAGEIISPPERCITCLRLSTTTWTKLEYNWLMNIFLFNFNMCKLNEK